MYSHKKEHDWRTPNKVFYFLFTSNTVRDACLYTGYGFPFRPIVMVDTAYKTVVAVGTGQHAIWLRPLRQVVGVAQSVFVDVAIMSRFIDGRTTDPSFPQSSYRPVSCHRQPDERDRRRPGRKWSTPKL